MENKLKNILVTTLRNKMSTPSEFRQAVNQLAVIIAGESSSFLSTKKVTIETPLETTEGVAFEHNLIIVGILRAGMAMLPSFRNLYPNATIGFIGCKRDEETAEANVYYKNIPTIGPDDKVIILDPTLATGGTAIQALNILSEMNVKQEQILFAGIIASTPGLSDVRSKFPNVQFSFVVEDSKLNHKKFILPGVGDFGDRYYGTE